MSGICRFTLADKDVLEPENVVRHVCGLRYVGMKKVDALSDVLRDRNPTVTISALDVDLMAHEGLDKEVTQATVVIVATDNEPTRYRLNEMCVRHRIPLVVDNPTANRPWFGPIPTGGDWNPAHGADPDVIDFHRYAAGEPEHIVLSSVDTLTRLNRIRWRRT